jgi:hypothetical protein
MQRGLDERINFKVERDLKTRIDKEAERLGLDRSQIARRAISEGLKKIERAKLPGSPEAEDISE